MSAYDMMNEELKRRKYPALDVGSYAEDVERGIMEAEKKAAEIERQAKRDRDMALIGDMAHLVSQGAAMHGGAWKIGQTQNEGAQGNERLRALREKNAAQTAAFAKERAALMEAKRKEHNAQKLAQYNAELEAYKRAQTQANADRDFDEKKRHNEEIEKNYRAREQRLAAQGGGSSDISMPITFPDGTVRSYSKKLNGDNWENVMYEAAVAAGMPRLMRERLDADGNIVTYEETSLAARRAALEMWSAANARALNNVAGSTNASPLNKGKMSNNNKNTGSW